eukprot:CAMPEP_0201557702 /NCGR_PEP_ID=MMETSP0173_2-20130828/63611_1 /ASSEMBLY_ACC=CAM_ASM_000268 /TAXON_ID=218659 /ORGANISM="Vexillifera sp., Strain DIVA3 564/2" /LENGTH=92 /DNA_ID=CAMNT_0047970719 /DNA_START=222 /DNA_END=497 /DNA_ORIENTATION=-
MYENEAEIEYDFQRYPDPEDILELIELRKDALRVRQQLSSEEYSGADPSDSFSHPSFEVFLEQRRKESPPVEMPTYNYQNYLKFKQQQQQQQ